MQTVARLNATQARWFFAANLASTPTLGDVAGLTVNGQTPTAVSPLGTSGLTLTYPAVAVATAYVYPVLPPGWPGDSGLSGGGGLVS